MAPREGKQLMGDVIAAANEGIEALTQCREELMAASAKAQKVAELAHERFAAVDVTYQALHRARSAIEKAKTERSEREAYLERLETEALGEFRLVPWVSQTRVLNDDHTRGEIVSRTFTLPVKGSPAREAALAEIREVLAIEGLRLVED